MPTTKSTTASQTYTQRPLSVRWTVANPTR